MNKNTAILILNKVTMSLSSLDDVSMAWDLILKKYEDSISLCKRAIMHIDSVGDIPVGHPMIEEMREVVAEE